MELEFTKMHGCGNDYIYINCFKQSIKNANELAIRLSNRHFGIGADGIICLYPSDVADGRMEMFNADGSEGKMCGNGVRCIAKFLYDNTSLERNKAEITIETKSGIKRIVPFYEDSQITKLTVNMGSPIFKPSLIPVDTSSLHIKKDDKILNLPIKVEGKTYKVSCLSMGNPHCVVISDSIDDIDLERIGPQFEDNKLFPDRINTEFVQILDKNIVKMRVWERGSGETLACGTGACAVCVVLYSLGLIAKKEKLTVKLRGGSLDVSYDGKDVFMSGEAVTVFKGKIDV